MRVIDIPNKYSNKEVFETCISGIGNNSCLSSRLSNITNIFLTESEKYEHKADNQNLFQLPAINETDEFIVTGNVSKGELKLLYSEYMLKRMAARKIYDYLRNLQEICPSCGFGHVHTLDHYLPKSKFPLFSVTPSNLVPSCTDCNSNKGFTIASTAGHQPIHPYFDSEIITTDQWLFAEVEESSPIRIRYKVIPPSHWSSTNKQRVKTHFDDFKLSKRFAIQAANELATPAVPSFIRGEPSLVKEFLNEKYEDAFRLHINSWKTAMYQALASSAWYCNGGYEEQM